MLISVKGRDTGGSQGGCTSSAAPRWGQPPPPRVQPPPTQEPPPHRPPKMGAVCPGNPPEAAGVGRAGYVATPPRRQARRPRFPRCLLRFASHAHPLDSTTPHHESAPGLSTIPFHHPLRASTACPGGSTRVSTLLVFPIGRTRYLVGKTIFLRHHTSTGFTTKSILLCLLFMAKSTRLIQKNSLT